MAKTVISDDKTADDPNLSSGWWIIPVVFLGILVWATVFSFYSDLPKDKDPDG